MMLLTSLPQIPLIRTRSSSCRRTISHSGVRCEVQVTKYEGITEVFITHPSDIIHNKVKRVLILREIE